MSIDQSVITFAKALADETRQEIMKLLCCEWLSVNDVVDALGGRVNQPTVSHHLKLLADADLVELRQEGRQRFYTLNQARFTVCCGSLMRNFAPNFVGQALANLGCGPDFLAEPVFADGEAIELLPTPTVPDATVIRNP
jgi:ArsR family transcriptional regulator, arsenate/arsenite/antimonite-responsive transcriptional repressor